MMGADIFSSAPLSKSDEELEKALYY